MIQNVGFQFNKSARQWMAAFAIAAVGTGPAGAATAQTPEHYYELMSLEQIAAREAKALAAGDTQAYGEYDTAAKAIRDTVEGRRATPHDLPDDFEANLYAEDNQENLYKVIDPARDIDWTEFLIAQKTAKVKAEKAGPGTVVETILADGRVETTKTAGLEGGYCVTNPTGEQYLVDTKKFESIYGDADENGFYTPKPDPRKVVHVDQNVAFTAPWGEPMLIKKGGALVHENVKSIYGIQPDEYAQTYSEAQPT